MANNTTLETNTSQKNRVYAPVLLGLSIILVVTLLYPLYTSYMDSVVEISSLEKTKAEKTTKLDAIKNMQALFVSSGASDIKTRVSKYNHKFNTSDIIESVMINNYTTGTSLTPPAINIANIAVDPGKKLPSGLSLANVTLSLSADTPDQIIDYLTYLTQESRFAYTIDSISLPIDTASIAPNTV